MLVASLVAVFAFCSAVSFASGIAVVASLGDDNGDVAVSIVNVVALGVVDTAAADIACTAIACIVTPLLLLVLLALSWTWHSGVDRWQTPSRLVD